MKSVYHALVFILSFTIIFTQCSAQPEPVSCNFNQALEIAQCGCFFATALGVDSRDIRKSCREGTGRPVIFSQISCMVYLLRNNNYAIQTILDAVRGTRTLCAPNAGNTPPFFVNRPSNAASTETQLFDVYGVLIAILPRNISSTDR